MTTLYIPVGIPGCGKSTMAEAVGADAIVSSDTIREAMGDVNDQSRNDEVFAQYYDHIGLFLRGGKSVFADATNLDSHSRDNLRKIVEEINQVAHVPVATHLILFRNLGQAIRRNSERERVVPADAMIRMIDKYERAVAAINHHEVYDYVTEVGAVR